MNKLIEETITVLSEKNNFSLQKNTWKAAQNIEKKNAINRFTAIDNYFYFLPVLRRTRVFVTLFGASLSEAYFLKLTLQE